MNIKRKETDGLAKSRPRDFCGRLCIPRSRTRILLMNSSRFRSAGSGASLDSAPGELPMDSSTLQQPPLPLSLSLGRSPDSHAREKACIHTNLQILWSTAGSMLSGLHCTAPHRTARQTAPKIALLHTINSLPCSHRACAFSGRCNCSAAGPSMPCAAGGSLRLGALGVCGDFGAVLDVSMKACCLASMPP